VKTGRLARWGLASSAGIPAVRPDPEGLAFDAVLVREAGVERRVPAAEFLLIPLDERIRLNFARALVFLSGAEEVPTDVALRSLLRAVSAGAG
jgi:hypothetical protein